MNYMYMFKLNNIYSDKMTKEYVSTPNPTTL